MASASGGWENWSWGDSLFAGAARYFEQGRLPYAPGLADAFARGLALDGRGRLFSLRLPDNLLRIWRLPDR